MILGQVFNPKAINVHLESEEKDEVFEELIEQVVAVYPNIDREKALASIREREQKMSTGIKSGIAVPHGKTDALSGVCTVCGAIGISKAGIDYDSLDKKPVHMVFLLLSSTDDCEYHLRVLRHLSQVLDNQSFCDEMMEQTTADGVYSVLCKYDNNLT